MFLFICNNRGSFWCRLGYKRAPKGGALLHWLPPSDPTQCRQQLMQITWQFNHHIASLVLVS
jgi:hypothetical protein